MSKTTPSPSSISRRLASAHRTLPFGVRRAAATTAVAAMAVAAGAVAVAPANAADPRTFTLVGDLQSELGCGADWQPDCAETALVPTEAEGVYAAEFSLPAGSYEYKVAVNGGWDEAYGLDGGDGNIPIVVAGPSTLRFVFNDTTKRVGVEARGIAGDYSAADDALVTPPVRQPGSGEVFYFVLTDRFANGDTSNDRGGIGGGRLDHGFDPTDKAFYNGGDIQGLRDRLEYIEGLGTTAIWLTPSFKNRPVQGEGANASAGYHGYWVTDFTQLDPHLGTNEELEALIDDAHARGIKVYFDIIANHTADVIDYEEAAYSYIDQATSPYRDANGNVFDPADVAGSEDFPELDAATSFPYTPVISEEDADVKVPAWLNDPTLYHNRGNSTWSGESVTYGDFDGLDDLMTENPKVVNGFVKVYQDWIDLGIDGFRIDTVKHVNFEFWERWSKEVMDYAHAQGKNDFFMFGEVYDADPKLLSPYVRKTDMSSVLDFTFQAQVAAYASGNNWATALEYLFAGDDYFTTPESSASALPTFLGNHDMGRIGYALRESDDPLARSGLAHEIMFLTRGQPVVYYGDEQGFAGVSPGNDKSARQSLFASQVEEYTGQSLLTGESVGSVDRYDTDAPLYSLISELAALRAATPALKDGAQYELYVDQGPGVYAFSRVARDEKVEHLVALNNTGAAKTIALTTLTAGAGYEPLYGGGTAMTSDSSANTSITVPARSAVVWRADRPVTSRETTPTLSAPAAGAGLDGIVPVSLDLGTTAWNETSFAWRVLGSDEWHALGTAESAKPRVFHDTSGLAKGTLVEYRAVTTDAAGDRFAVSSYASIGNAVTTTPSEPNPGGGELVTVPGSHNSEMGCPGDWQPDCEAAALTLRDDGVYEGTFELPAGDYEYKVAVGGSWDVNYGVGGAPDGANAGYTHTGGSITFYYDPRSHVFSSTAQGPVVTLPGSLQSELGCAADWMPDCLATLAQDGDGDGVYEFVTDQLPAGSYEVKAAHGLSWDENYGEGGARDGANLSFAVAAGKQVTFRYTLATHVLTIDVADPPLAGFGELRAQWVSADTIAWPKSLLGGVDPAELDWTLYGSATADLSLDEGAVAGGDAEVDLVYDPAGLNAALREKFPHLADSLALTVQGQDRAAVQKLLRGQLQVLQTKDGAATAYTGVQLPGVIDELYGAALAHAQLGVSWAEGDDEFAVWAPTARAVSLLLWPEGGEGEPQRVQASFDEASGVWSARAAVEEGAEYLWSVEVYAPSTGAIEKNDVTDPYSHALTTNSTRSVAIDLSSPTWMPQQWREATAPRVEKAVDHAIYELHVRDFSINDETVPEEERGTYRAFTRDSAGAAQLRELADAGITTIHLLPTFDLATIEERRSAQETPPCELGAFAPDSAEQQACISEIRDADGFNWGYDPFHYSTPEGSYAVDPEGGARVAEFREMVGALHGMGLQVVLDQVFNHTAEAGQGERSVLDRVVPGYYQRLNAAGAVETSTCCSNVATENAAAEKLMVDSVVTWARDYRVDGFRFDLMGHHSRENMLAVRAALDELTLEKDGVDGKGIYLYGEGWNFGEVANNARFEQATQGQLGGTGIGTFNDRLRDGVHGGSPVDAGSTFRQGYGTGLGTDPNGDPINGSVEQALVDLGHVTDLVKIGLAGNLRSFEFTNSDGQLRRGEQIDYNGSGAGYADEPGEVVNYVDAHDNETLYDLAVLKLPADTPMADRVRMNTLMLATATLSQGVSFWHAGTELLRSKSLDRNSYNSGDWFNRVDWTGQESTFGSGLPPAADNQQKWGIMAPLLANPALKPTAADIAAAEGAALDLLRVRSEVGLLRLGDAELIREKLSFPNGGTDATPGVIVMLIDDLLGDDVDPELEGALVVFNASPDETTQQLPELAGRAFALTNAQAAGADEIVKRTVWRAEDGSVTVPARTVAVLVEEQLEPSSDGNADGTEDGVTDGVVDGATDGASDGATDGGSDGGSDGAVDGGADGASDGAADSGQEGTTDGGTAEGAAEPSTDTASDGSHDGATDDGASGGPADGSSDGLATTGADAALVTTSVVLGLMLILAGLAFLRRRRAIRS